MSCKMNNLSIKVIEIFKNKELYCRRKLKKILQKYFFKENFISICTTNKLISEVILMENILIIDKLSKMIMRLENVIITSK